MEKKLCILHANCQGKPLLERLNLCPEFRESYECRLFTNYVREPVPVGLLANCSLFLYQHLGDQWGELASQRMLARVNPEARTLCVPNMFFKGYWLTWDGSPGFNFRCKVLDKLCDSDFPIQDVIALYMLTDPARKHDLKGMLAAAMANEEKRERLTPIKYMHLISQYHGQQKLFNTVNHPGPLLMNHVARGVLRELGFTPPDREAMEALGDPFPELEQPINPKVASFFGWDFADAGHNFRIYGRHMTFARWVANYVFARRSGVTDFVGFLLGDYIEI